MQKLLLFFLFFSCFSGIACAQTFYSPCKDSSKIENIYYPCYEVYGPVCGCDGITYRNWCVAENQYALSQGNYTIGPCSNYDYDISPNQVFDLLKLNIQKKNKGYFAVSIFDTFGHLRFLQTFSYSAGPPPEYMQFEISTTALDQGLYIIEVVSKGEQQVKKFFKVNLE
jgi:hypothetical protein